MINDGCRVTTRRTRHSTRRSRPKTQDYFEHDADIGVIGRGPTLEAAFVAAAEAVFAIMAEPAALRAPPHAPPCQGGDEGGVAFEFEEPDLELALVTWLNRLLAEARSHGLALCRFQLQRQGLRWVGRTWGQPWRDDLVRGTEVKGATLTMLSVRQTAEGWEARCVVDV